MGCSPSVLLEHIHRDSTSSQEKHIKKSSTLHTNRKEQNKTVLNRKSSLALTPEDETLDLHKSYPDQRYGSLLVPHRSPLKLLLVFFQLDQVGESLSRSADKLGFEITYCGTEDVALEEYQAKSHDLVVIDTRSSKTLNYETLCRSIRNSKGSQYTIILAIVKRSLFEKDDVAIMTLFDAGFTRCLPETTNAIVWSNELIQLKQHDLPLMLQQSTAQVLYAALDKCKDLIIITDDQAKCQYVNRACEVHLNLKQDDLVGKTLQEQFVHDPLQLTTLNSSLLRGREWNGPLTLRRKSQDVISGACKAVPIAAVGRMPTHFALVVDPANHLEAILGQSRGSVHSIRRGSSDVRSVGSDYLRRASLAKLTSLPLEAPITKIISMLEQVRENSNSNTGVIQILDRIEDMLKSSELYTTYIKEDHRMKTDEPVVSDLITALLSKQPQPSAPASSRRNSNDSAVYRSSKGSLVKIPAQLRDLLETSLTWEFDIFRLEDITKGHPLQHLGMNLFGLFDVAATLNCDERTLYNWLTVIEANYHSDNPYHTYTHAADVMQATACFLEKEKMKSIMDPLDEATSLIAAAAHDVDHPGRTSAFLANSDNALAILYNDSSILESHHSAMMFKLTLGDDRVNIFKNLDREMYKVARHTVIDMILATEMTKHFEYLAKFVNVFCAKPTGSDSDGEAQDYAPLSLPENILLVKRMMIKCSDVSNPARPMRLCVEWARRITEEYFQQTDEEKSRGLPIVMPMFDKNTCSIPKSQIGFIDYIINDMFEAWNAFIDMPELVTYMRQNYIRWKEFDEQGHRTLADVRKLQANAMLNPMFPSRPSKKSE